MPCHNTLCDHVALHLGLNHFAGCSTTPQHSIFWGFFVLVVRGMLGRDFLNHAVRLNTVPHGCKALGHQPIRRLLHSTTTRQFFAGFSVLAVCGPLGFGFSSMAVSQHVVRHGCGVFGPSQFSRPLHIATTRQFFGGFFGLACSGSFGHRVSSKTVSEHTVQRCCAVANQFAGCST